MKIEFGFIQGRVTRTPSKKILQYFPTNNWQNEFSIASKLGFRFIEYFGERIKNKNNPIWSKSGLRKINNLAKKNKLKNYSFCDDFFIKTNLLKYSELDNYFNDLANNLSLIGIKVYVLALFEKSLLKQSNFNEYSIKLKKISKILYSKKIKLTLETNLSSNLIKKLFAKVKSKNIFLVYDTGNRLKNKKLQYKEILELKNTITHIHLKDKNLKGENVVFGTGNVDFKSIFRALKMIDYKGKLVFETNRGSDPLKTMINNKKLVLNFLDNI